MGRKRIHDSKRRRECGTTFRGLNDFKYTIVEGNYCIYCGDLADVYDHVPPICYVPVSGENCFKYPSCKECNHILGTYSNINIDKRRKLIFDRTRKKHKKTLQVPHWEESELNSLDSQLANFIILSIAKKKHLLERLDKLRNKPTTQTQQN